MAIIFDSADTKIPHLERLKIKRWINAVAARYGQKTGDIAYIFCSDSEILRINNQYLNHDYYTDIITFDYSENGIIAGDIFISVDTVKSNSEKFKTAFNDELHRVIIHGILHLLGFKDKSNEEEKEMRKKEDECLLIL